MEVSVWVLVVVTTRVDVDMDVSVRVVVVEDVAGSVDVHFCVEVVVAKAVVVVFSVVVLVAVVVAVVVVFCVAVLVAVAVVVLVVVLVLVTVHLPQQILRRSSSFSSRLEGSSLCKKGGSFLLSHLFSQPSQGHLLERAKLTLPMFRVSLHHTKDPAKRRAATIHSCIARFLFATCECSILLYKTVASR